MLNWRFSSQYSTLIVMILCCNTTWLLKRFSEVMHVGMTNDGEEWGKTVLRK